MNKIKQEDYHVEFVREGYEKESKMYFLRKKL